VNVATNTTNCGACGNVCGANETCGSGQCTSGSTRGMTGMGEACGGTGNECCGSTCTDVRSAVGNCGMCGNNCATTVLNAVEICSMSLCGYASCDPGFGDCVGGMPNGCETNLQTTLTACGSCSTNCNTTLQNTAMAGRACASGTCNYGTCTTGFGDCDGSRPNGCETSLASIPNCGGCGQTCSGTVNATSVTCSASRTCDYGSCLGGFGDCDMNRATGCETNTNSTLTDCGDCDTDCNMTLRNTVAASRMCTMGNCDYGTCSSGFGDCDSNRENGCETNTNTTLTDCGNCMTDCNMTLQNTVAASRMCMMGTCNYGTCASGFGDCDSNRANGCETNTNTTLTDCGNCMTDCNMTLQNTVAAGRMCVMGDCDYGTCSSGFDDCDSNRENGCEAAVNTTARCGDCTSMCGMNETCNAMGNCQCGTALTAPTGPVCSGGMVCDPTGMGGMGRCM
jgi:hypothetical protein